MSYVITRTDGSTLVEVQDQTIDSVSTSISLVGKGALNYGKSTVENFVAILENFSAANPPSHPMIGQLWYDKTNAAMRFYDGSVWQVIVAGNVVLPNNSIATSMVQDNAINTSKLSNRAVTLAKTAIGIPNQIITYDGSGNPISTSNINQQNITIQNTAGNSRGVIFQTDNNRRWAFYTNTTAETGGNSGSNLVLKSYDDTGIQISIVFSVARATGIVTFGTPVVLAGDPTTALAPATKQYVDNSIAALHDSGDLLTTTVSTPALTMTFDITAYDYLEFVGVNVTTDGTSSTITGGNRYPGVGFHFGLATTAMAGLVSVPTTNSILSSGGNLGVIGSGLGLTSGTFFGSFIAKRLPGTTVWAIFDPICLTPIPVTAAYPPSSRLMKGNLLTLLPINMDHVTTPSDNVTFSANGSAHITAGTVQVHARKIG